MDWVVWVAFWVLCIFTGLLAAEVCGCEFWWVDIFILFLVLRWVEVDGIWLNLLAWLWVFSSGLRWVAGWVFVGFCWGFDLQWVAAGLWGGLLWWL